MRPSMPPNSTRVFWSARTSAPSEWVERTSRAARKGEPRCDVAIVIEVRPPKVRRLTRLARVWGIDYPGERDRRDDRHNCPACREGGEPDPIEQPAAERRPAEQADAPRGVVDAVTDAVRVAAGERGDFGHIGQRRRDEQRDRDPLHHDERERRRKARCRRHHRQPRRRQRQAGQGQPPRAPAMRSAGRRRAASASRRRPRSRTAGRSAPASARGVCRRTAAAPARASRSSSRPERPPGRHRARPAARASTDQIEGRADALALGRRAQKREPGRADEREHRHELERQRDAAGLVQPAADRRADDDAEARAGHHVAHHAAAIFGAVAVGDEREADHPGDAVGGALNHARREQRRQRVGAARTSASSRRA